MVQKQMFHKKVMRHEGIFRMIWLHFKAPEIFWNNITLFVNIGSWKDIITMLSYDLQYNGWESRKLNWDNFGKLLLAGLENPNTSELVKKYLPQIKSNSQCKTLEAQADNIIAKNQAFNASSMLPVLPTVQINSTIETASRRIEPINFFIAYFLCIYA